MEYLINEIDIESRMRRIIYLKIKRYFSIWKMEKLRIIVLINIIVVE